MLAPVALCAVLLAAAPAPTPQEIARALANDVVAGRFKEVTARFDEGLARKLTAQAVEGVWKNAVGTLGAFKELGAPEIEDAAAAKKVVWIDFVFEGAAINVKVVVEDGRVSGLWLAPRQSPEAYEAAARQLVDQLSKGEFERATKSFSPTMAKALPQEKLKAVWEQVLAAAGALKTVLGAHVQAVPQGNIVDLECGFTKKPLTVRAVLDGRLQTIGLFFLPAWEMPEYANVAAFDERVLKIGEASLPGSLSMPKGEGPFPAVVLVHGSGAHDADETLGANRPLRDLAWGLASHQIAALRYPKRNYFTHGKAKIATVKDETVDDAVAAVELLAKTPGIDPKRIFVVGHSLGALLAPRIALGTDKARGTVLLAAPTRPYGQMVVEQLRYLWGLSGKPTPEGDRAIHEAEVNQPRIDKDELKPDDTIDGLPASYWLDLRAYSPTQSLLKLARPALVLQGERDYQVTMVDFEGFKKALAARSFATLKSYPKLNHLFVTGTGKSTPAEYNAAGHVDKEVVDDIASWIRAH